MFENSPILTTAGLELLLRAIEGEHVTFTRFKVGAGVLPAGTAAEDLTDLVDAKLAFPIAAVDDTTPKTLKISGHFSSLEVAEDFRLRELGLYAKGEDNVEVLYCYDYDAAGAGTVRANGCAVLTEQDVTMIVAIDEAQNISVELKAGILYALKSDLDNHMGATNNPHHVTPEQMNVTLGSLDHYEPIISGDSLARNLTRIAKAMAIFNLHVSDLGNPHQVDLRTIGAAAAKHSHSAEDLTGGVLPVERGGTGAGTLTGLLAGLLDFTGQTDVTADTLGDMIDPCIKIVSEGTTNKLPFTHKDDMAMEGLLLVFHSAGFLGTYNINQWIISLPVPSSQNFEPVPFGLPVEILRRQANSHNMVDGAVPASAWSAWE